MLKTRTNITVGNKRISASAIVIRTPQYCTTTHPLSRFVDLQYFPASSFCRMHGQVLSYCANLSDISKKRVKFLFRRYEITNFVLFVGRSVVVWFVFNVGSFWLFYFNIFLKFNFYQELLNFILCFFSVLNVLRLNHCNPVLISTPICEYFFNERNLYGIYIFEEGMWPSHFLNQLCNPWKNNNKRYFFIEFLTNLCMFSKNIILVSPKLRIQSIFTTEKKSFFLIFFTPELSFTRFHKIGLFSWKLRIRDRLSLWPWIWPTSYLTSKTVYSARVPGSNPTQYLPIRIVQGRNRQKKKKK